jgi:DNA-binding transcriptional ArsR family regulator
MAVNLDMFLDLKVKFFKGFGDKTRLAILDALKGGEKTVSEIVSEIEGNQSNVSQHLACLKGCGIVKSRQEGKFTYYSLRNDDVRNFLDAANAILRSLTDEIYSCCRNDELIK